MLLIIVLLKLWVRLFIKNLLGNGVLTERRSATLPLEELILLILVTLVRPSGLVVSEMTPSTELCILIRKPDGPDICP